MISSTTRNTRSIGTTSTTDDKAIAMIIGSTTTSRISYYLKSRRSLFRCLFCYYYVIYCCYFVQIRSVQSSWAYSSNRNDNTHSFHPKGREGGYHRMLIVPSLMQQQQYSIRPTSEVTNNATTSTSTNNDNVINNNNSNSQKKRRLLFLDRIALVSEKLLRFDNASMLYDSEDERGGAEDAITAQSDLTLPNRHIHVVTTAALPWMTGTSVNPLLRAAYLCKMTKQINSAAAAAAATYDNTISTKTSACPEQQYVTLVLPWLELPQDRRELYPSNLQFDSPEDQELYIRNWMREQDGIQEEADPNTGIRILFYPARYHSGLRSIFAMGDVCKLILTNDGKDPEQEMGDVAILEEAEHLNFYRAPGDGWTKKFKFVIGVMHTNYKEYAAGHYSGLWTSPAIGLMSSAMVRAYCHKVIKLSDTLQTYAPEKECVSNVHGVRQEFITEGERRGKATIQKLSKENNNSMGDNKEEETKNEIQHGDNYTSNIYFIGKILWAKGLARMIDLQEYYKQCTGQYFPIDIYGSGPEEEEIKRAFFGRNFTNYLHATTFNNNKSSRRSRIINIRRSLISLRKQAAAASKKAAAAAATATTTITDYGNSNDYTNDDLDDDISNDLDGVSDDEEDGENNTNDKRGASSLTMSMELSSYFPQAWTLQRKKITTKLKNAIDLDSLPKSTYELLRKKPIPATFFGRVDHALLKENYKIFVNPSLTEVLCTTSAEALAMGKFVILPVHPSNEWFLKFPNCLAYRNRLEFAANLRWALTHEPEPLSPELAYEFTWTAATERFVRAAAITKKEAHMRAKLGLSKLDERIAYFINEAGKGSKGDALRKALGGGPVAHQVKYEMERQQLMNGNATLSPDAPSVEYGDEDAIFGKFEQSWFASIIRSTFGGKVADEAE